MTANTLVDGDISDPVIGAFYRVYNRLGFGFLESVYKAAMDVELRRRGMHVSREAGVRVYYEGIELCQYKIDMLVNETLIVEIKSTRELHPVSKRQVYNYLRATDLEVGLLLHFGPEPKFYRLYSGNLEHRNSPHAPMSTTNSEGGRMRPQRSGDEP